MFSYALLGMFICILGVSCCERPCRRRAEPFLNGESMRKPLILSQWSSDSSVNDVSEESTEHEIYTNKKNNLARSDIYESNV